MSLQDNLLAGWAAYQQAWLRVPYGAGNRFDDLRGSWGWSGVLLLINRGVGALGPKPVDNADLVRKAAANGEYWKAGNCTEMASIAILYLLRIGVRPIEFVALTNVDHSFVVIGRPENSDASDHLTWGHEAVICDPWDKGVYAAQFMSNRMHRGQIPGLRYHGKFKPWVLVRVDEDECQTVP